MLKKSLAISLAVVSLVGFASLAQVDPGFQGPKGMAVARFESLPELLKAIAQEVKALEGTLGDLPALKGTLSRPLALIDKTLAALKEKAGAEVKEGVAMEIIVLDLALHRLNEVSLGKALQAGPHLGPKGPAAGRRAMAPVPPELRTKIEAYLKGAEAALSPEEAAKFHRIVRGLMEEVRGAIGHPAQAQRAQTPTRMELGRHLLKLRILTAQLDRLLLGRLAAEVQAQ